MFDINILTNLLTEFYFSRWLFMGSCFYGLFRLCRFLILNR